MDRLWAPWRQEFIQSKHDNCIFCSLPAEKDDKNALILLRGESSFIIMNRYPYNSGHLMVAPYRHISNLSQLKRAELVEMMKMINMACEALEREYRAEGFNIGANIGKVAGAGYEHLHIHVVPRWKGDTNYMPVIAETKVLPENLEKTYSRLKKVLEKRS